MRLLLDENLPKRLKAAMPVHEIFTVRDMNWNGKQNGELLREMLAAGFEALLTFDKNLRFQQNFAKYPLPVVVLIARNNQFADLLPLVPALLDALEKGLPAGPTIIRA